MQFVYDNLHVVAAAMILSGHMKIDLEYLDEVNANRDAVWKLLKSADQADLVDIIVKLLNSRFDRFRKQRITQQSRRTHWSIAYANLSVVAAAMILNGHMKVDLECLDAADSLLITDSSCFIECETHPNDKGAYLYFDLVRRVFTTPYKYSMNQIKI